MATLLWILGAAVVLVGVFSLVRFWRRTTAPRVITCPENGTRQAVEIDAAHRLGQKLRGHDDFQLAECSRWPEMADCDQPCREQIANAPDGCRVRAMLDRFYAHQGCALCGKEFGEKIDWYEHEPGFVDADRHLVSWQDVPAQQLEELMRDHYPICWDCKVLETVRQEHPERVTDRLAH